MKTKNLAIVTAVGVMAVAGVLFAFPAMAATSAFSSQNSNQLHPYQNLPRANLQVGQTFTLTSIAGGYQEVGNPAVNGSATGSLTIKVTGAFTGGYSISVTGGQVDINGTTYSISGGSGEIGPYAIHMVGQAQAGSSAQALFAARDLGRFGSTTYGVLRVDLTNGTNEFGVRLLVTISST